MSELVIREGFRVRCYMRIIPRLQWFCATEVYVFSWHGLCCLGIGEAAAVEAALYFSSSKLPWSGVTRDLLTSTSLAVLVHGPRLKAGRLGNKELMGICGALAG